MNIEDIYKPGTVLDMPKRPPWDYNMSKPKVLAREEKHFRVCISSAVHIPVHVYQLIEFS